MGIMAALGSIKWVVIGLIVAAIVGTIGTLYWQNSNLRADNAILTENQAKLEDAVRVQTETIKASQAAVAEWKASAVKMQKNLAALHDVQVAASAKMRNLENEFAKHDLRTLSRLKPALVESRINGATADTLDSLRHAAD